MGGKSKKREVNQMIRRYDLRGDMISFIIHIVGINVKRNKNRIIINTVMSMLIIFMLCVYDQNVSEERKALNRLSRTLPVTGNITNLNGSQKVSLVIEDEIIQELKQSSMIKDFKYTISLMAGIGDFSTEQWKERLTIFVTGTNSVKAITGLDEKDIDIPKGKLDVLASRQRVCIVEKDWLKENGFEIGDTISLNQYYYDYQDKLNPKLHPLSLEEYLVIGTMDTSKVHTEGIVPNIIIPVDSIREEMEENGVEFYADSASFALCDPLQLNEFKNQMKKLGLMETIPTANYSMDGNALILNDNTFLSAANQLRQSMRLYNDFFPFILLATVISGYVISYLLVQNRKQELAIMRCMGCRFHQCVLMLMIEQMLALVIGGGTGVFLMAVTFNYIVSPYILLEMVTIYLPATFVAIIRISRRNLMQVLTQLD